MIDKNTERTTLIGFITRMLSGMDMRRVKLIYEFVLEMTSPDDKEVSA